MIDQQILENELGPNETARIVKNVGILGLTFMLYYIAYSGAANLQSSINAEAGLGTVSLAAVYAGSLASNIFLPPIVIKWLGTKWAMFCSLIGYMPFIAFQIYPRFYTLMPSAFFLGLASGPLWCASSTYLSVAADAYSTLSKKPSEVVLQRFFGLFFMIYQMGQIWGNLISSLVLSTDNKASVTSINETMIPQLCGANFLVDTKAPEVLPTQPPEKIQILTGSYFGFLFASVIAVVIGLDSMKRYEPYRKSTNGKLTGLALLVVSIKLMREPDQLLFVVFYIFSGLQQAFVVADFTASFVSCAIGTGSVGYVMLTFGVADALGCFVTGYLAKLFGRLPVIVATLFIHVGLLLTMLLWHPHAGDYYVMFIIATLWGLCDSVWIVQINAYCGLIFHGKEEAAFPNYRLFEGVGFITTYALSSYVKTQYKICLLLTCLIVGISGYFTLEFKYSNSRKMKKESNQLENVTHL